MSDTIPPHAFALPFTASDGDIDELGHVNNAVWVGWMQRLSVAHWSAVASTDQQAAMIWVIVRHEIDYLRPLLPGGHVIGYTWVGDAPKGAKFDRLIAFAAADGTAHVRARTTWALLDRASGRPMRVSKELAAKFAS